MALDGLALGKRPRDEDDGDDGREYRAAAAAATRDYIERHAWGGPEVEPIDSEDDDDGAALDEFDFEEAEEEQQARREEVFSGLDAADAGKEAIKFAERVRAASMRAWPESTSVLWAWM